MKLELFYVRKCKLNAETFISTSICIGSKCNQAINVKNFKVQPFEATTQRPIQS